MYVVVEPKWGGHHPTYFARVIYELAQHTEVLALSPDCEDAERRVDDLGSVEKGIVYKKISFSLDKIPIQRKFAGLFNYQLFSSVKKDIEESQCGQVELVFFCCLYHGAMIPWKALDKFFPYKWKALMIDVNVCHRVEPLDKIKDYRAFDLVRAYRAENCDGIFTLEHERKLEVKDLFDAPMEDFPEICEFRVCGEEVVQEVLPSLKKVANPLVGVFGHINQAKSIIELIRSAKANPSRKWGVFAAGPLQQSDFTSDEISEIQEFFKTDKLSIAHFFEIDELLYNYFVKSVDLCYICYKNFTRSSNNILKAAYFKKPVLVMSEGCLDLRVRKYGLGEVLRELSPERIASAIECLLSGYVLGDPEGLVEVNSVSTIASKILKK